MAFDQSNAEIFPADNDNYRLLIPLSVTIYVIFGILYGYYTDFLLTLTTNDFWGNQYVAAHLADSVPESLYNGFFPIGYHIVLRLLAPLGHPVVSAYILNVFLGAVLIAAVQFFGIRLIGKNYTVLFTIFLVMFPRLFQYLFSAGADTGSVTFFSLGVVLMWRQLLMDERNESSDRIIFALSGVLFGLSALWRYHAFVAAVLFLVCTVLLRTSRMRYLIIACASFLISYSPHFIINLATGHGLLETSHELNVYNLMYEVNWWHVSDINLSKSMFALIAENPVLFLKKYAIGIAVIFPFALPSLFMMFYLPNNKIRRLNVVWFCICTVYSLIFGISASPRAVLLLIPVSFLFLVMTFRAIYERIRTVSVKNRNLATAVFILFIGLQLGFFTYKDVVKIRSQRERCKNFRQIEALFVSQGVTSGEQIFTSDFHFYFKTIKPWRPLHNGGWVRIETYGYDRDFPEFDADNLYNFTNECESRNVRYLLLSPRSGKLSELMWNIYNRTVRPFEFIAEIGEYKVFRISKI